MSFGKSDNKNKMVTCTVVFLIQFVAVFLQTQLGYSISFSAQNEIIKQLSLSLNSGILNEITDCKLLVQDWLAFTREGVQLTFQGKVQFENGGAPLEQDNFAFCKVTFFHLQLQLRFTTD